MSRRPTPCRARAQRGLSLIELAVVLVIIALLMVAVAPEISQQLRNARIRNAAEAVQQGLLRARAEAISRNQTVRFSLVSNMTDSCTLAATGTSWIVSLSDPAGQCDAELSMTVEPRIIARSDGVGANEGTAVVAYRSDSSAANTVLFNAFGRTNGAADRITRVDLTSATTPNDFRRYRIEISEAGGVRICEPAVTSTNDPRRCQG